MSARTRLWNRDFTLWWLGTLQSAVGTALSGIALSFLVLRQTGSAGAMGVTLALGLLPGLLAPLAGTLVDRVPLKAPLILGEALRAAVQLGLGVWALSGHLPLWAINLAALVMGLLGTFHFPAANALLPGLVPEAQLSRANGLMGAAGQGASLLGLLGGGLLVGHFGSAPSLIADGVSYAVMAGLLSLVRLPRRAASQARTPFIADLRAGFDLIRRDHLLRVVPWLALLLNASFAPLEMLLPKRMLALGLGASGFGAFFALETGGMLLGSALAVALGSRLNARLWAGGGLLLLGGGLLALSSVSKAVVMLVIAAAMGVGVALSNVSFMALLQQRVAGAYLGRVFSLLGATGMVGMPLMLFLLAPVADHLPITVIFAVAGSLTLLVVALWLGLLRQDQAAGGHIPQGAESRR